MDGADERYVARFVPYLKVMVFAYTEHENDTIPYFCVYYKWSIVGQLVDTCYRVSTRKRDIATY